MCEAEGDETDVVREIKWLKEEVEEERCIRWTKVRSSMPIGVMEQCERVAEPQHLWQYHDRLMRNWVGVASPTYPLVEGKEEEEVVVTLLIVVFAQTPPMV
ncbi:unnamed protein product [Hydatigera taeniaeformis]|uniref:Uncharacterized protein n=1 Tax=Hydatigena taeniaeformis TaxID=6205 RepID=A0A0R3X786_HYDTA|nr:unnamed protein product [Hydatigera taeniaeformis]